MTKQTDTKGLSRRQFMQRSAIAGGGLIVAVNFPAAAAANVASDETFVANAFIQITAENEFHFWLARDEMGQGVMMGLATLIGEELDIDPNNMVLHHAPVGADYAVPGGMQSTGGSTSISGHYWQMRQAGAQARDMLARAAAAHLGTSPEQLKFDNGFIIWNDARLPYGQFAGMAAALEPKEEVPLKQKADFKYIGKETRRNDALAKVTGTAKFGLDVDLPDLHRAVLVRCPVYEGSVISFDDSAAKSMPGVVQIVQVESGIAVVAKTYPQAKAAAEALEVQFNCSNRPYNNDEEMRAALQTALDGIDENRDALTGDDEGDVDKAFADAAQIVEADYYVPYLVHAPMEPMNATVRIDGQKAEVWTGTQAPSHVAGAVADVLDFHRDNVTVHNHYLGGGFGRRGELDYIAEATQIAQATGLTIQLIWSREDDTRHGSVRPASQARMKAALDETGKITGLKIGQTGPNIVDHRFGGVLPAVLQNYAPDFVAGTAKNTLFYLLKNWFVDPTTVEGLAHGYAVPNRLVKRLPVDPGLRTGFWRSVGHSVGGYMKEAFADEMAAAAGKDPMQFRLDNLGSDDRMRELLKLVAAKGGWGKAAPGRYQGIAGHNSFGSGVAELIEISIDDGELKLHKVTAAVNCGTVVNPDIVRAQIEGAIVYGLTAALYGEITLEDGAVAQSNFHDYPILRNDETPEIEVHIVDSDADPTGIGEPGLPPIAGALANAIYAATGTRVRELPLTKFDFG